MKTLLGILMTSLCGVLALDAADWPQFRGPEGRASSPQAGLPLNWSASQNIIWKTPMPGFGASSPITAGDRIFVTCYSGYGLGKEVKEEKRNLRFHLVCVNSANGVIQWDKTIPARQPPRIDNQTDYVGFTAKHGYASSTPVSDGRMIFAFFADTGVVAFDQNGQQVWAASVGEKTHGFGSGASPILHGNLLIVNASIESGALVALDKASGKEVWRAPEVEAAWNTPVLVDVPGGQQELVVITKFKVLGFDPSTGKALWNSAGIRSPMYVCPSATTADGIVYAVNGYHGPTVAVRPGGRGDVTATHQLWTVNKGSTVSSPVYHNGHLYWANDQGLAICVDAKAGKLIYQERLEPPPGDIYASAVVVDEKIYYVSRKKGTFVVAAKLKFELLAHNTLDGDSVFNATPAVHRGRLFLRSDKYLYCIGKK